MTVIDFQDGKLILLSKPFDTRAKILNIIYFAAFSFAGILFMNFAISTGTESIGLILFTIVVVGVYLFAGYRFINKAFQSEKILVNKSRLKISKTGFISRQENFYDISLISNFRHLDKPETTKHPLAGQSFDYLGFQTEEQVINEMHGDDRLAFNYNGRTIKFGENIYSWDFEQLEILLYDITGNDFRYTDDFEETFKTSE
jgi:hypothetical protein